MKIRTWNSIKLVLGALLHVVLISFSANGADLPDKENFFESILRKAPNEVSSPALFLAPAKFSNKIFGWLMFQAHNLNFGLVTPKYISEGHADDKRIIMLNNQDKMMELVEHTKKDLSLRELMSIIDKNIEKTSLEDALSAAKAFRHIFNNKNAHNHPLGDFVCYYVLSSKIIEIAADNRNLYDPDLKAWLSNAYYEISQVYSHLIDYSIKKWDDQCLCTSDDLTNELTDGGKRIIPGSRLAKLCCINYCTLINHKLALIKYSILNNPDNHLPWVRAIEFFLVDFPQLPTACTASAAPLLTEFNLDSLSEQAKWILRHKIDYLVQDINKNSFVQSKWKDVQIELDRRLPKQPTLEEIQADLERMNIEIRRLQEVQMAIIFRGPPMRVYWPWTNWLQMMTGMPQNYR